MTTKLCIERTSRLFAIERSRHGEARQRAVIEINGQMNTRGVFHSSMRLQALEQLYRAELRKTVESAWDVRQATHKALGSDLSDDMRQAHKSWMGDTIRATRHEMSAEFAGESAKSQLGKTWVDVNLTEAANLEFQRYDPLIDNYFDMAKNEPKAASSVVINAQTIGAVVTGDRATMHIKQDAQAVAQLTEALRRIKEVLPASNVTEQARRELMQITGDAERELAKSEPNEAKLVTLFTVLALRRP